MDAGRSPIYTLALVFWTVVFGVIVAVVILWIVAAISEHNPGCAGLIVLALLLIGLARCLG
jgi:hypothetical protein